MTLVVVHQFVVACRGTCCRGARHGEKRRPPGVAPHVRSGRALARGAGGILWNLAWGGGDCAQQQGVRRKVGARACVCAASVLGEGMRDDDDRRKSLGKTTASFADALELMQTMAEEWNDNQRRGRRPSLKVKPLPLEAAASAAVRPGSGVGAAAGRSYGEDEWAGLVVRGTSKCYYRNERGYFQFRNLIGFDGHILILVALADNRYWLIPGEEVDVSTAIKIPVSGSGRWEKYELDREDLMPRIAELITAPGSKLVTSSLSQWSVPPNKTHKRRQASTQAINQSMHWCKHIPPEKTLSGYCSKMQMVLQGGVYTLRVMDLSAVPVRTQNGYIVNLSKSGDPVKKTKQGGSHSTSDFDILRISLSGEHGHLLYLIPVIELEARGYVNDRQQNGHKDAGSGLGHDHVKWDSRLSVLVQDLEVPEVSCSSGQTCGIVYPTLYTGTPQKQTLRVYPLGDLRAKTASGLRRGRAPGLWANQFLFDMRDPGFESKATPLLQNVVRVEGLAPTAPSWHQAAEGE